jgi:hypothetical protein
MGMEGKEDATESFPYVTDQRCQKYINMIYIYPTTIQKKSDMGKVRPQICRKSLDEPQKLI